MRIRLLPLVIGRLSENVPSPPAVPLIDSPVVALRAMIVERPCVLPSSVTALRVDVGAVLRRARRDLGRVLVEDRSGRRGDGLRLAARPDDRDAEVVDALGQRRPG